MSGIRIERLTLGELDTNCFLVSDGESGPLIAVDPAGEPERVLRAVAGRPVAAIVLTHAHFDHLGAVTALVEATGAPLLAHRVDAPLVTSATGNGGARFGFTDVAPPVDRQLEDGDVVEAGALRLEVLHTPGHTAGSMCLLADTDEGPHLFSGDTLFSGSVGRTDFPAGSAHDLRASIGRLALLPPSTVVHPGHGPDTTIAREARANFFWPRA